jgi:hypothetical protein
VVNGVIRAHAIETPGPGAPAAWDGRWLGSWILLQESIDLQFRAVQLVSRIPKIESGQLTNTMARDGYALPRKMRIMKRSGKRQISLVVPIALLVIGGVCIPLLIAQTASTGALTGTVTDPSKAVVTKAQVVITNLATGKSQTTGTGADGGFRFSLLTPGKYKVKIDMAGFKTAEFPSIPINVTEITVLNCTLEVGAPSETFIVQSETEALQTASSTLGTLVDSETITALPLTSRNYTQILDLSTGVSASVNNATVMGKGTQYTSVNGATPAQNNYQMDGVGIVNIGMNGSAGDQSTGTGIGVPNPDAIQEFKVQTSTFDASYGRNPGGNVNVVTKSGGNSIHGSAFEFLRNTSLNANPFFYNRDNPNSATQKPILNQNQFGFLFGSYQGSRQKNGLSSQGLGNFNLPPIPDRREISLPVSPARKGEARRGPSFMVTA